MTQLGPFRASNNEGKERYVHLFSQSLKQSITWSLQHPRSFNAARHITSGTRRHYLEVTRGEIEPAGSGQMRLYGPNGSPVVDFDFDHGHGQGVPHVHNWQDGSRGPGLPFSLLP